VSNDAVTEIIIESGTVHNARAQRMYCLALFYSR